MGGRLVENRDILRYVLAGKAIFTIKSLKTGRRYTYKVTQPNKSKHFFFISYLGGNNNEAHYRYMCVITEQDKLKLTKKSKVTKQSLVYVAFEYVHKRIRTPRPLPEIVEFWHEGSCGVCGRRLTVPDSIKTGIGPICIKRYK